MLRIRRTTSNRIITRALERDGSALVALLAPDAEDYEEFDDFDQLQAGLDDNPGAFIVYNQNDDAVAMVSDLVVPPEQVFIEIRQDTKGVLGLQAFHKQNHRPEPLELLHE